MKIKLRILLRIAAVSVKREHGLWKNCYVYGKRSDRALQNNDLITWKELLRRNDGSESKDKIFSSK